MKIYLVAMALISAVTLGVACGGEMKPSAGVEHYNAGVVLQEQGQFEQAIAEYDEAISLDPEFALAYVNRGGTYLRLGESRRAIKDLDEAIRLDPDLVEAHVNRGITYLRLGEPRRAMQDLDEAIRLDPEFALAYSKRGNALEELGKREEAIQAYSLAIDLDPLFEPYHNRGLLYSKLGQYERAIQDYNEAIRLNPQRPLIFFNRGVAYSLLGRFLLSIQDVDEAIRLDPLNAQAYGFRATVYTYLGMSADAERNRDRAVELGMDRNDLEGQFASVMAGYSAELSLIQTAVDLFFTAADNARYLGRRQFPILGSNSGTGDRSMEILNTYGPTDSGSDLPTPLNPLRGTQGGDPKWRDDGDGIRTEENLNAEAESEAGSGSGWFVAKVKFQGTDYSVDTRDYFIDFKILVDAGILLSVPESASLDNGGGTSTGRFSWYVEASGLVKSLPYHLPK